MCTHVERIQCASVCMSALCIHVEREQYISVCMSTCVNTRGGLRMLMLPSEDGVRCPLFFLFLFLAGSFHSPSEEVIALELGLQSEKSTRPSEIQIQVLEFAACLLLTTKSAVQGLCHL